jgi:hypothetical protein
LLQVDLPPPATAELVAEPGVPLTLPVPIPVLVPVPLVEYVP